MLGDGTARVRQQWQRAVPGRREVVVVVPLGSRFYTYYKKHFSEDLLAWRSAMLIDTPSTAQSTEPHKNKK